MATLIDHTYFIRDLSIGQGDNSVVQGSLQTFIDRYEEEYLLGLMGYNFKKIYETGIVAVDPIYVDIRDGKEFTNHYNVLDKWIGLRNATTKKSPIANYVYYWWSRDNISKTLGDGEFINKQEKKYATSPEYKMMRAWNEMVCWNKEFWNFMYANRDVYPEFFADVRNYSRHQEMYHVIHQI
jgi:hypothetical protein